MEEYVLLNDEVAFLRRLATPAEGVSQPVSYGDESIIAYLRNRGLVESEVDPLRLTAQGVRVAGQLPVSDQPIIARVVGGTVVQTAPA